MRKERRGGGLTNRSERPVSLQQHDRLEPIVSSQPACSSRSSSLGSTSSLNLRPSASAPILGSSRIVRGKNAFVKDPYEKPEFARTMAQDPFLKSTARTNFQSTLPFRKLISQGHYQTTDPKHGIVYTRPKLIKPTWQSLTRLEGLRPDGGYGCKMHRTVVSTDSPDNFQIEHVMKPMSHGKWKYVTRSEPAPKLSLKEMSDTAVSPCAPDWFHLETYKNQENGPLKVSTNDSNMKKLPYKNQYVLMDLGTSTASRMHLC